MFLLQAHPSSCSQQGPTWPCPPSSPTATATQQHQATANRHSPASVMACEHPTTPTPPSSFPTTTWPNTFLPSVLLSLCSSPASHGLLLTTGATSKQQPTLVFEYYFFIMLSCYKRKHLTALKDFYLYCLKRNWTTFVCFSHSIFMTTYLEFFCVCLC